MIRKRILLCNTYIYVTYIYVYCIYVETHIDLYVYIKIHI